MATANYVLLERIELNAPTSFINFFNIPQSGYTDLKVVISARSDFSGNAAGIYLYPNNSSASVYSFRRLYGDGVSATSNTLSSQAALFIGDIPAGTSTTNTFGNAEFYIPNYNNSSVNKSISIDCVTENNGTTAYTELIAGLSAANNAISTLLITNGGYNFVQYSTFSLYGIAAIGTTPVIAPKASGGNITTDGTYWIHTFLTTGAFVPSQALSCDYLVVAGGGGGGTSNGGGGGGAGGLRSTVTATGGGGSLESKISVASGTSYTITVGAGGAKATDGNDSVFSTVTSLKGARGGDGYAGGIGGSGTYGSGSGAGRDANLGSTGTSGGAGTSGQGYAGGSYTSTNGAGGGGGAGAVGYDGVNENATSPNGNGGAGVAVSITSSSVTYGGGGGGSGYTNARSTAGGSGGGGNGSGRSGYPATAGTVNTGGGGGGGSSTGWGGSDGLAGGSGIVIIRYAMA